MPFVVDVSVAACWLMPDEDSNAATVAWLMILIPFLLGLVLYGRYGRHALWGIAAIALLVPGGIVLLFGGGRSIEFVTEGMLPLALVFGVPSTLLAVAIAALFRRLWRRPPAP